MGGCTTMAATSAIAGRVLRDSRVRTGSFTLLFALVAYANAAGYSTAYPTLEERLGFAHSFGNNAMLRLFYGAPHDLVSLGGYSAWRVGGFFAILAAAWGLVTATAAFRGEEEAGRSEIVLSGPVTRRRLFFATAFGVGAGALGLWGATLLGLLLAGLPLAGSAYLALCAMAPGLVFAALGALLSQLASTRRLALELSATVLGLALALRTIADTASGLGWLRWLTPLGWSEQMRPFTGARPAVLLLFGAAGVALLALALRLAVRRDIGRALLQGADSHPPRRRLLSSPTALALRQERVSLAAWLTGTALYGVIAGVLCASTSERNIPPGLARELRKLGVARITNPADVLGLYFLFFVLIVALFGCAQVAAARREESDERLETLLAQPLARSRWLLGRLALALGGAVAIALTAGVSSWAGSAVQGAGISLAQMLEAGLNCLPLALMFLGAGFLAFALVPRASAGIAYGLLTIAFVWDLFGSLLGAPRWLVELTPFQHIGFVPAQAARVGAAGLMLAVALVTALAAQQLFIRRDLIAG
jgi:polyether ionophore transport system permease protein